jgi:dTDP-4-dehydrorhamnose reductase
VDACEENEETARLVNGTGAGIVARAAAGINARLIHISTDYVFDGTSTIPYREDHPTGPPEALSAYGRSKLLGEERVLEEHPGALIVRTAWLYGRGGSGFPNAILRRAREVGKLRVVHDQTGSPTLADDFAEALYRLAHLDIGGLLHVTNSGRCTWYEFAGEILRRAAIDVPVAPVTTADYPRPARRPAFSVLDNSRYESVVGRPLRSWQEALADYMGKVSLEARR